MGLFDLLTLKKLWSTAPGPGSSVRIEKLGPAAIIHYKEDRGSYDFDAELCTGDVLLSIYAPRDDGEWERRLPWAAGRRAEVLERVARHVIRQESWGSKFIIHPGRVDILTSRWF